VGRAYNLLNVKLVVHHVTVGFNRLKRATYKRIRVLFVFAATVPSGPGPTHSRGFYITHNDAPQSVGLLWTSDQLVAETYT